MVIISLILIAIGAFFAVSANNRLIRFFAVLITVLGVVVYFVFSKNDVNPNSQQGGLMRDSITYKYENLNKETGFTSMIKYSDGTVNYILMKTPTVVELKESWRGCSVLLCDTLQGKPVFKEVEITKTCYDTLVMGQRLDYFDFQGKLGREQKELSNKFDWALSVLKVLSVVFVAGLVVVIVIKVINRKLF